VLTGVAAAVVLRFWEEVANRALLDQVTPLLLSSSLLLLLLPLALSSWKIDFCFVLTRKQFLCSNLVVYIGSLC
jgi:hypothetical protein